MDCILRGWQGTVKVASGAAQIRDLAERSVIQRALVSSGFNRTRAADALGISRVTLYKKMKKYGLLKESARM